MRNGKLREDRSYPAYMVGHTFTSVEFKQYYVVRNYGKGVYGKVRLSKDVVFDDYQHYLERTTNDYPLDPDFVLDETPDADPVAVPVPPEPAPAAPDPPVHAPPPRDLPAPPPVSVPPDPATISQAAARNITGFFLFMRKKSLYYGLPIFTLSIVGALYYHVHGNNSLALGLLIIATLQPFFNNSSLIFSYLLGNQRFKINTIVQILSTTFITFVTVLSVLLTENVAVLLISYFLANIFSGYLVEYFYTPRREEVTDKEAAGALLRYTEHSSLQNIISIISNQLDKVLIFQNLGATELAIYTFATALPDQYKGVTKNIEVMLLPRFSQQTDKSLRAGLVYKSVIYFFFLLLCLAVYAFLSPYIFKILYPQYEASVFLSQIYAVGIIFGIGGIPLTALKTQMSNRKLYRFNILTSAVQIISLIALLPLYGLIGAAIARIIYRAFVCIYAYYLYYKI